VTERLAVFASGSGSNLQSIIDRFRGHSLVEVALVVTDRPDAGALRRAEAAGIETRVITVRDRAAAEVETETLAALHECEVGWIALAGYLRLVPAAVVRTFEGRIFNVHPALLPAFGGAGMYGSRVHDAVLKAGCRVSGPTIHLVDEEYDRGRILMQWPVPVLPEDTAADLAARVLSVEHAVYPIVLEYFMTGAAIGAPPLPATAAAFQLSTDAPSEAQVRQLLHSPSRT
jgi:phosphoribosylglycinamide formyltransferase 1